MSSKWTIVLDVIQDVRSSIAMFMFIIEEAIQTAGMACYILYKQQNWEELKNAAQQVIDNLITPGLDFVNTYGAAAIPLNMAYSAFYDQAKTTFQTYIAVANANLYGT